MELNVNSDFYVLYLEQFGKSLQRCWTKSHSLY